MPQAIIRLPIVKARTGLSRSTIYDRINSKSAHYDPSFPRPISLGARSIGWVEAEIEKWISERVENNRKAVA